MEKFDSLKADEQVTVTIWGPDGTRIYQATNTGFTSVEEAVRTTITNAGLELPAEDCVFQVTNEATLVSHKYRFNAHGHLVLLA